MGKSYAFWGKHLRMGVRRRFGGPFKQLVGCGKLVRINAKILGLMCLVVLIFGLAGFIYLQKAEPTSQKLLDAEAEIQKFSRLTATCLDSLKYDKQYTDNSDIQAERSLNATALLCRSLRNRLDSAEQTKVELENSR